MGRIVKGEKKRPRSCHPFSDLTWKVQRWIHFTARKTSHVPVCPQSGGPERLWRVSAMAGFTHYSPSYWMSVIARTACYRNLVIMARCEQPPSVSHTPRRSVSLSLPLGLSLVATLIKSVLLRPWLLPPMPDPCIWNFPAYVKVYVD